MYLGWRRKRCDVESSVYRGAESGIREGLFKAGQEKQWENTQAIVVMFS